MDASELADLNPFDLLDLEAQRLDRHCDALDGAGWDRPSRCAGWSVRDVLAHLAGQERYNHACLDGDIAGFFDHLERERVHTAGGYDDFNAWCVEQRRGLPVKEVLAEWREANGLTRRRMRERGRDGALQTSVGSYPVGLQTFHYASEYATHGDDVDATVDAHEESGRLRWRARFGRFALAEQDAPVEVTELDDGYRVVVTDPLREKEATATLTERDFVAATVSRLPADHGVDRMVRDALACLA